MPHLITLCGAPGSGKSTLSRKIAEEHNLTRYSFDELECFFYEELINQALDTLETGRSIILDALFDQVKDRKKLLESVNDINCKKILIVMTTPLEECLRRNAGRLNPLPDFVVKSVHTTFEPPTLEEGWDDIRYYGDHN